MKKLIKIMPTNDKINITTIGGWKGSYALLSSLRDNDDYDLSAIISMSDSWGITWVLREQFDILPPGDVRRGVMALSREHELVKQLFDYRYGKDTSVWGHSLGNLLITAMADITGSFDKWLKQISKMFRVKGRVIPVTLEQSHLCVKLEDKSVVFWETNIDLKLTDTSPKIKKAFLTPDVQANPKAIKAIEKSDMIILSFGDLYTSVIPNLLVKWIPEAIKKSNAKIVYFCNLMTKKWETTDFEVIDFIAAIEKYLWKDILDYVIVNNGHVNEKLVEKYKQLEKKKPVKVKSSKLFRGKSYKVIERDLLHENEFVRHSYDKVAAVIDELVRKEIG